MHHMHRLQPPAHHHSGRELLAEMLWVLLGATVFFLAFALLTVWQF